MAPRDSSHAVPSGPGLAKRETGPIEVLSQSIANIAPSGVVATGAALIYVNAGEGTWLSYLAATLIVLAIGYCIAQFARRSSSAGSVYSYTAKGLRPSAGFASGWAIMIGYLCIAAGSIAGFALFGGFFVEELGSTAFLSDGWQIALFAIGAIAVTWATVRGIRLSTRVGLILEIVSITAIGVVLIATVIDKGIGFDTSQLSLEGSSMSGVTLGIVLAILGFVGFESAASLGVEARNPKRAIPRAILWSAAGAGLLYVFGSYIQVNALGGETLTASSSPLGDLAANAGLGFLSFVIDIGVMASFFACAVASITATTRMLYTMGHEGLFSHHVARTHGTHRSPHIAVYIVAPFLFLGPALPLMLTDKNSFEILAYIGTLGTFGFMVSYALVALAAPVYLWRIGERSQLVPTAILGVGSAVAMGYVFFKNVSPAPPAPFNYFPWAFAALMAAGMVYYMLVHFLAPERTRAIGSFIETDPAPAPV